MTLRPKYPVTVSFGLALFFVCPLYPQSPQTLRQAGAYDGLRIGTAVDSGYLTEPTYASVLAAQYSQVQAENEMKFDTTEPSQNVFNFVPGDAIGAFAAANQMAFRGHNLVWYQQVPTWVTSGGFTPQQLNAILQNNIANVVGHFAGTVYAWDVVNEAFDDTPQANLRSSVWYDSPGIGFPLGTTGYVEQAFQWARQADPNALLFYNDYGTEDLGPKSDAVYAMVQDFKSRGVPIDGVGFEMHIPLGDYPTISGWTANLARFTALGVQVQITEMDVRLLLGADGQPAPADLTSQAQLYGSILAVCVANPNCTAFQTWGFTDLYSWIPGFYPGYGAALPFDANYNPKPAFQSILTTLAGSSPRLSAAGMVNAASYSGGGVAPGEMITLFGGALGPSVISPLQLTAGGTVSTANSGVTATFDGIPAPIVYVSATQCAVIVPYEVAAKAGTGQTTHVVVTNGSLSSAADLDVLLSAPGLFSANASGSGIVAAINLQDNTLNSAENPAQTGSYVELYGTGDGAEQNQYPDGALIGSVLPLAKSVTATVGGETATVLYAGGSPGLVAGVLQVNIQVPADLTPGTYPIIVSCNGVPSQSSALLAVK